VKVLAVVECYHHIALLKQSYHLQDNTHHCKPQYSDHKSSDTKYYLAADKNHPIHSTGMEYFPGFLRLLVEV